MHRSLERHGEDLPIREVEIAAAFEERAIVDRQLDVNIAGCGAHPVMTGKLRDGIPLPRPFRFSCGYRIWLFQKPSAIYKILVLVQTVVRFLRAGVGRIVGCAPLQNLAVRALQGNLGHDGPGLGPLSLRQF